MTEAIALPTITESIASAGAGSTGALGRSNKDSTREQARSTNFIGENSEITRLQRVREANKFDDDEPQPRGDETQQRASSISAASLGSKRGPSDSQMPLAEADIGFSINDPSYYLDNVSITTFEDGDPHEMPTPETAQHLFDDYIIGYIRPSRLLESST